MSKGRVAVVEDEGVIRQAIVQMLTFSGYKAMEAEDGELGLQVALSPEIDLVLLDVMLPKRDGFSVLCELRKVKPGLPVIILTAKGAEEDVVRGLSGGADDYMVKPFGAKELMARIEAVMRRTPARSKSVDRISIGQVEVDFEHLSIRGKKGGEDILSETECRILEHLAGHRGRIISREELLGRIWGHAGSRAETRTIDMHIARLRAKLSELGADPGLILTVRGKGYSLVEEKNADRNEQGARK